MSCFRGFVAFSLVCAVVGCTKPSSENPEDLLPRIFKNGAPGPAAGLPELPEELKSTVRGVARLEGQVPNLESLEEAMKKSADGSVCLAIPDDKAYEKSSQTWMVKGDLVENVIVFLVPPEGKRFKDKLTEGDVVVNQPRCQFEPHVSVVLPGQRLVLKNDSAVSHNAKTELFNESVGPKNSKEVPTLRLSRAPLQMGCQLHGWMSGYVWPTDNPYTAVTNSKGEFELKDVPTDVELTVRYWHEASNRMMTLGKMKFKEGDNTVNIKLTPR